MKDDRYADQSPKDARQQASPAPERPVPQRERQVQTEQPDKPSQAEGERETMEEKGL